MKLKLALPALKAAMRVVPISDGLGSIGWRIFLRTLLFHAFELGDAAFAEAFVWLHLKTEMRAPLHSG
jgi:hypothetical protein